MDKIFKVFLSSTFEDLREERAEVEKALLKLNCLPVGMELFPAADDETWEFIKGQVADSDYYIVLVAGRYGSIAKDGRSFTEMEFDYALELKMPVIGFVHANRGSIPRNKSEIDPELTVKLEAFISKVRIRPVRHFLTPKDLALEVTTSFVDLKARRPAIGFVRADQTVDFKKYSELLEENRDLKQRLEELKALPTQRPVDWIDEDLRLEVSSEGKIKPDVWNEVLSSWREIALLIAPRIVADDDEGMIFNAIAFGLLRKDERQMTLSKDNPRMSESSKELVRLKFVLEGIVTISTEQRSYGRSIGFLSSRESNITTYNAKVWRLTEFGTNQMSLLTNGR